MNVRVLSEYPFSIVMGGLELQAVKTVSAMKQLGMSVDFLDVHDASEDYNILHLFGNPPAIYDICWYAKSKKNIVISAVCGGARCATWKKTARSSLARIGALMHEHTDYFRLRGIFQLADVIICLNESEKEFICNMYDIDEQKISIIPNGVEESFFCASGKIFEERYQFKDFVLFTGNIVARKNPLRLARDLKKMGLNGVFIGNPFGGEEEYAKAFAEVISQTPHLLWIQGLPHDAPLLQSAYAAAKVFCLPSTGETQSLSALEAMAAGTPIILGNYPYAYQPPFESALRCNPNNESSIESSIKEANACCKHSVGKLPEHYSWSAVATRLRQVYEQL